MFEEQELPEIEVLEEPVATEAEPLTPDVEVVVETPTPKVEKPKRAKKVKPKPVVEPEKLSKPEAKKSEVLFGAAKVKAKFLKR